MFAGMISGVLIGTVALVPDAVPRARVALADGLRPSPRQTLPSAARAPSAPAVPPAVQPAPIPVASAAPSADPAIDPHQTLVTFLAAARGRRVVVDGRVITTTEPMLLACGKHTIRHGSGKARTTELPCGAALTLD